MEVMLYVMIWKESDILCHCEVQIQTRSDVQYNCGIMIYNGSDVVCHDIEGK